MPPERVVTERARYERVTVASLSRWIVAPLPKLLCFSDTHFVPRETAWSDDAPEDLAALVRALDEHEPLSLGDLTESVGLRASDRAQLFRSERLEPLWSLLVSRRARVVLGNHDVSARGAIIERFGRDRVMQGGFTLEGLCVRHGHEGAPLATEFVRLVGPWIVPAYERGRRWAKRPPERLGNAGVLASLQRSRVGRTTRLEMLLGNIQEKPSCVRPSRSEAAVRARAPFVLFGHTHSKRVAIDDPERAWANPGCFLRSAQSFIVLDGEALALYRRVP